MNIILIGSGAREHALAKKIKESKHCEKLFIMPGNAGTQNEGENVNISPDDFQAIADFALKENVQMIVVGPEDPLANGIADFFENDQKLNKIKIMGPNKKAAMLEASKAFAKEFMKKYNIPTASYINVNKDNFGEGIKFLEKLKPPYVLKATGLAAGKGVLIIDDLNEAKASLKEMLDGKFGDAGTTVVIEEFLSGIELSVFVLTDGKSYILLPEAKDYKRIGEGDTGLNTGGMGAVSPVPFADKKFIDKIENKIIKPTIEGIKNENINYKGFIFFGLIKVGEEPYVIEYNVRAGDPETEVFIPRIESDIVELFLAVVNEDIYSKEVQISANAAATVILASGGYPESYKKGMRINDIENIDESIVYHAGTKSENGELITNGGRVIAITSIAENIDEALKKSYRSAEKITFEGKYFRKDIGFDLK